MNRYARRIALGFIAGAVALLGLLSLSPGVDAQRPPSPSIQVDANHEGWIDTGVDLGEGETATLEATGTAGWEPGIVVGPAGGGASPCALIVPAAPVGALVARVGSSVPVTIGASGKVAGPGRLSLLYNDCPGQYFDNSGRFEIKLNVVAPEPVATPVTPAPVQQAAPAAESKGGGLPVLPLLLVGLVALAGAGLYVGRRGLAGLAGKGGRLLPVGNIVRFSESARLESSAWLAPVRLHLVQGERLAKRLLTIGGPDDDIDFGVRGTWARLIPQEDGSVRIERHPDGGQVLVDGMPLVLSRQLRDGSKVFMGTREFTFRMESAGEPTTALNRRGVAALAKADPRLAALNEATDSEPDKGVA